jgi:hypothetical protein
MAFAAIAAMVKSLAVKQGYQEPAPTVNDLDTTSSATVRAAAGGILVHAFSRSPFVGL